MKQRSAHVFIFFICMVSALQSTAQQAADELWYDAPAKLWTDALPIGNGRIGAMIYGGVAKEHIQFNESTLWTGGPRDYNHPGASGYLKEIRKLLSEGKQTEAEALGDLHFMGLKSAAGDQSAWIKSMTSLKGMVGNPALESYDDRSWKTINVPSYEGWEIAGLPGIDGAVWFRTTFDVTAELMNKSLVLDLNRIRDQDFTYINGVLVGKTDTAGSRKYTIPSTLIKKGRNVIAVQVLNFFDKGGIAGYKDTSKHIGIYPLGASVTEGISLVKPWRYKIQNDEPPAVAQFQASYQPFGDLSIDFKQEKGAVKNYKRALDLNNAIVTTSFSLNDVSFKREYLASLPNQAVIVRLTANRPGKISFEASLASPHKHAVVKAEKDGVLTLSVQVKDGVLKGISQLKVVVNKGSVKIINSKIVVTNADDVTLFLTAGTNFIDASNISGDPLIACRKALNSVENVSYSELKNRHVGEYQRYFNRFSVKFGPDLKRNLPTNKRIEQFGTANDPALIALFMQYGRYLLISSSRPGNQPANLQGIWNDLLTPPWGSKYTTNINLEMNYWPSEVLNLSDLNEPLFAKIAALAKSGAETAKIHYDAGGWVLHHNTDLWNGTAPINSATHGIWVSGGGWLSQHLWEHYLFTQDTTFLKAKGYPIMKQAAEFFVDFLVADPKSGWLISTPSNSPENGGLVAGPTMDHQIIRTLFRNCISASELLGVDDDFRKILKDKLLKIAPNQIGKYGQLQEWLEDKDDTTNKHRHVSHLWGVHPGNDITWDDSPDLMKAARQSLIYRGDEGTGWSLAWKINFWARFKEGDHAMKMIRMLLRPVSSGGGVYVNLFDAHPPFQIDGNFGAAAGIAEMLLQSHTKYIDLLPALPSDLPQGEVRGMIARGGFEMDFSWQNGKLVTLTILSKAGGTCLLRYGTIIRKMETQKGVVYKLNKDLKKL